ncbi:MAG: hypothetical protein HUU22_06325 [Phycisphaerae bacterium]|nr:hypothetical protein [Phycisphaerae bacterium]
MSLAQMGSSERFWNPAAVAVGFRRRRNHLAVPDNVDRQPQLAQTADLASNALLQAFTDLFEAL